ncbi:uncharacterized protein LOC108219114 isoform X1 [Daucus carota subsp. sativus]|uniref:uncharacterized protein LOC108219114 isoform X1 n=1 Tax=Daucus carota subsp. sativus TaxID=79200 RepID=UPI0007EF757C|nr:PREDICTED: uncharacterized protein LOC108219114 isoform X1 [Daucus carota subsp. sativus]
MAADQWRKRLSSASVVGYTSRQQHSMKRKKLASPQCDASIASTIVLEWDDTRKSVVAKKEQVGIAQRDLSPFIDAVPSCRNILADIVNVPQGTFDLENLSDVLSFEVWQTHLSEKERSFLTQFLPEGTEAQQVVQDLLAGDNFHFGNPFIKWSSSLCSGDLHPDAVLKKEHLVKANKKVYYSELQNYHYDMIKDLQILKARWSQMDPENDIGQNFWRSRKHVEKALPTNANKFAVHESDENLTSESCSSAAGDKACSGDELNFRSLQESQKRKGSMEDFHDDASDGLKVVARKRKGEKIQMRNVQSGDGAKYMSYIKVSKEQHQRVKSSMKHSSNSIQSKSLNHVLGDIDTYYVQPYKVFEEEERHKLHVHWSKLANVDIAAALTNWRRRQIEKRQVMQSLSKELAEDKKSNKSMSDDQVGDEESDSSSTEDEGSEISNRLLEDQMNNATTKREPSIAFEDGEEQSPNCLFHQQTDNTAAINEPVMVDGSDCVTIFPQNHVQHNTVVGGNDVFNAMDMGSDENILPGADDLLPDVSNFTENMSQLEVPLSQENPLSVACDVWPAASMSNAYYNPTHVSRDYSSANDFSRGYSQVMEEHPTQLINLKTDMRKVDNGKDLMSRQADDIFLGSYPNQVQSEQFQSFFRGPGSSQYNYEQKPALLSFQPLANMMIENSQPVGHFKEQLHPVALDQRLKDPFMHQSIQENMRLDGLRHALPRQDHFSAPLAPSNLNMQNWGAVANTIQLSGVSQSHPIGDEMSSHNWISGESQGRGGWSGLENTICQNQSSVNGGIGDQSLFSVLSHCNNLNPSPSPRTSFIPEQRFNQPVNYNVAVPTSNILPQMVNQRSYLNVQDTSSGLKGNNMGWTSLPHQNTPVPDSTGKPYLRYWNH